ncbi:hypothetical protein ACWD6R_39775 [Streptomyces sp. NPDC005151]
MRRFGRRLATAVTGITVLGMAMSTASANAAGPTPAPSSPTALNLNLPVPVRDNLLRAAAGTKAGVPLTLVTGDKVQIGVGADRKPVVSEIEPAARPGLGVSRRFQSR